MKRMIAGVLLLGAMLMFTRARGEQPVAKQPVAMNIPAPEFENAGECINSKPLQVKDLRGQVAVVHFWTFG
jgi:hypothetical protein